jgi:hypothetical protein
MHEDSAMRETKAGSFTTFLQARQGKKAAPKASPVAALGMIARLVKHKDHEMPLADLMEESEMGFAAFSEALESMQEAGVLELTGKPGEEIARLTDKGRESVGLDDSG